MVDGTPLKYWLALSVLLHLAFLAVASMVPWTSPRKEDVMIVDLADLPRSPEFTPPKPGILREAQPSPPPKPLPKPPPREKPRVPPPDKLTGRVPDLPVDPDLPPEKTFPEPPAKETQARPPGREAPPRTARAGETPPEAGPTPADSSPLPEPGPPQSLRDITPTLGRMVMAKTERGAGRGEENSSGSAAGTGGKAAERGEFTEERGGGAHLTALNAPEIQYISYFAGIKRKIELIWQYPQEAAAAGIQGDLVVDFIIGRSGDLVSVELLRGSGSKILDDEAIGSIRMAAPYHPIPERYKIPDLRIRAHFVYEMHSLRIR
ncbi:MAG TPA: TonB family protein [Candidatus Aquicultoraceae bacterium]|jgi:protein TonB|nr:TonB family protein [Candidatus Aquicultoraceae bacterium]